MLKLVIKQGCKRKEVSVANCRTDFDLRWVRIRTCQGKDLLVIIVHRW